MASTHRASRSIATTTAVFLALESSALGWLGTKLPDPPAPLDPAQPLAPQLERIDREFIARLPPLADQFAWWPLTHYPDERQAALAAGDPASRERHVARLASTLAELRTRHRGAIILLASALLAGAIGLAFTALRRPSPASLFAPLACCLAITPVITEPIVGTDFGTALLPFVLPMLIGGGLVLLLELQAFRAPARRLGGFFPAGPTAFALLAALVLGGLGATGVALGLDEHIDVLVQLGAIFIANAVVQFAVALVLGVRQLARRRR